LAIRSLSAEEQLSKPTILTTSKLILDNKELIMRLARTGNIEAVEHGSGLYLGTTEQVWIKVSSELIAARRHRLEANMREKVTYFDSLKHKLANTNYTENAPEEVVADTVLRRDVTAEQIRKLEEQLKSF
jgi:valyl-tRNA synthetase